MKRAIVIVAVAYLVIGAAFSALALWRPGAWIACAAVAAGHIGYEHYRLANRPRTIALHAAAAVALAAFGLALAANIHAGFNGPPRLLLALVTWPVITAIPSFLAAWVVALVLARLSPRTL
jgi:hypothetical protein